MTTSPIQSPTAIVASPVKAPVAKKAAPTQPRVAKPAVKKPVVSVKPKIVAKKVTAPVAKKAVPVKSTSSAPDTVKVKKPKLVRDSFTMPKDEYIAIDTLKLRSGKLGQPSKKSELLRAGIKLLVNLSDIQLKAALSDIPSLKTGRPKNVK
jgi:hypothetical protein